MYIYIHTPKTLKPPTLRTEPPTPNAGPRLGLQRPLRSARSYGAHDKRLLRRSRTRSFMVRGLGLGVRGFRIHAVTPKL